MAIKQIFIVATISTDVSQDALIKAGRQGEDDLNTALSEGYSLIADYPTQTSQMSGEVFVMHKPDRPHAWPDDVVEAWRECQRTRHDEAWESMAEADDNLVIVLGKHLNK